MPNFIAIEGVIGVGKTTLARRLQSRFDAEILLEVFEENPFLPSFYKDRERYAFQTQLFFLLSRYQQQRQGLAALENRNLISDYTFAKDQLFAWLNLKDDELGMYDRVHAALAEKLPKPDLIVFLRASHEVLMRRITLRDRPYERDMDPGYIIQLAQAYEAWLANLDDTPVLIIETDEVDFLANEADLEGIMGEILGKLAEQHTARKSTEEVKLGGLNAGNSLPQFQHFHQELDHIKQFDPDLFMNFVLMSEEMGAVAKMLANIRRVMNGGGGSAEALEKGIAEYRAELGAELADVLAYVLKMANYAGINLETAYLEKMRHNVQKTWS